MRRGTNLGVELGHSYVPSLPCRPLGWELYSVCALLPRPGKYLVRGISLVGQAGIWRLLWAWGSHLDRPTGNSNLGGRTALNYPGFLCTSALLRLCKALAKR